MKMYCEKCHRVFEGEKCPDCRKKAKREVEPDDVCLLTEKPQIWADMLSDVLEQNGIPFYTKGVFGAGLAIKIGPMNERFKVFVMYRDLERAGDIVDELFNTPVENGGDDDPEDEE